MPHAIIHKVGSDEIFLFIHDAVEFETRIKGSRGCIEWPKSKADRIGVVWVDDSVQAPVPTNDITNEEPKYAERVSDYTPVEKGPVFKNALPADVNIALSERKEIADLTYQQIDNYFQQFEDDVDALDLTDAASVKAFLKSLVGNEKRVSKVLLGHIKLSDHFRKK